MKTLSMESIAVTAVLVGENTRTIMNKEALKELTANVKANGVLEPIVLRKDGAKLHLVAGARRLQAAKDAGLKTIPANVMELTEQEAERVQAIENLHREDLNPADEAEMFEKLLMANKKIEDLALELNKSKNYITRSVALLSLPKPVFERIRKGTLSAAHGHAIVRVVQLEDEAKMKKVLEKLGTNPDYTPTPRELRDFIDTTFTRDLKTATFDKTECKSCPKCTKNQTGLFDVITEELCDDAACFRKKVDGQRKEIAEKAKNNGHKGMKYLGAKEVRADWNSKVKTVGKAGVVLDTKLAARADIKKALKETPEKFGFAIDKETNKPVTVITDEALLKKVDPSRAEKKEEQKIDWEQRHYVGGCVQRVAIDILKRAALKPTTETYESVLRELNVRDDVYAAYFGTEEMDGKILKKMTPALFLELLTVNAIICEDNREDLIEKIAKGSKEELAAVAKQAEENWPKIKAEAEAKAAKGTKSAEQPEDEE